MSCQKGNGSRSRPQKYQNSHSFKNDLHDKSKRTQTINAMQVAHVCEKCKHIIEWKIKYKKYKPLKAPGKCNKCDQKTIKHSYHTMCQNCAKKLAVCPKCGNSGSVAEAGPSREEQLRIEQELQETLRLLPERKRRTFSRYLKNIKNDENKKNENSCEDDEQPPEEKLTQKEILEKLKAMIAKEDNEDLDDFSLSDESESSFELV